MSISRRPFYNSSRVQGSKKPSHVLLSLLVVKKLHLYACRRFNKSIGTESGNWKQNGENETRLGLAYIAICESTTRLSLNAAEILVREIKKEKACERGNILSSVQDHI
jgi:hypothetical protein